MFTLDATKKRYRATISAMEPDRMRRAGDGWERAGLGLFFRDLERAVASTRDTLEGMLLEDRRTLPQRAKEEMFDAVALDQTAGDAALLIHLTYSASQPRG